MAEYYYKEAPESTQNRLELLENELEYVKESYGDAVRALVAMENVGWNLYSGLDIGEGFDLDELKKSSKSLREWTDSNALLFRGWDIRCDYMFGGGYKIDTRGQTSKISQRIQDLIDKEKNQDTVFSEDALKNLERSRYTDGSVFLLFDTQNKTFKQIPIWWISDVATDPDDVAVKWFYQLKWSSQVLDPKTGQLATVDNTVWYRTDTADKTGAPNINKIADDKVDTRYVIVDDLVNVHAGNVWGVPDSFAAAPWALAYSAYLRDGAGVLAALNQFAWKLTPQSKKGGDAAGERIKSAPGVAGTVVTNMDMNALPKANTVDLNDGRPLAAQVASALGLSVIILLSDPGQGGAFATANTLTDPSTRTLLARQRRDGLFLERCLRLLGIKDPSVVWEKMNPDADYREMQTLTEAIATGVFHTDEYRETLANLAHLPLKHDDVPEGYLLPNNENSWARADIDPKDAPGSTPVAKQGVSTVKPVATKPPTKKKSSGVNDLRGTGGRDN